jgi:hypothetical protein
MGMALAYYKMALSTSQNLDREIPQPEGPARHLDFELVLMPIFEQLSRAPKSICGSTSILACTTSCHAHFLSSPHSVASRFLPPDVYLSISPSWAGLILVSALVSTWFLVLEPCQICMRRRILVVLRIDRSAEQPDHRLMPLVCCPLQ